MFPLALLVSAGCGGSEEGHEPFALRFAALVDGAEVGCTDDLGGFGPNGTDHVGINDLRFYVSNLRFLDAEGNEVHATLDTNEFQLQSPGGFVALIDLTGSTQGSCRSSSVAFAEGTARTHQAITGTTHLHDVVAVAFDIGVPQPVMKTTIATNTAEGAPSPLNEMYWNWNSGYRHFVFNFAVRDGNGDTGGGYLHVGSRDCAPAGDPLALADRDRCTYVNTPAVALEDFELETDTVGIDLRRLLAGLDFRAPIYDPNTFEVIGDAPGAECHSSPMQPDCAMVFSSFGLEMSTGNADAARDAVFVKK
jgi:uncharacterized repeat protein (TIGR04052 family)